MRSKLLVEVLANIGKRIITSGYNGAPPGEIHCCDGNTFLADDNETCLRCIHAEMNGIYQAARFGNSLIGTTLYTTCRPCDRCTAALIAVGVKRMVYRGLKWCGRSYDRCIDAGIQVEHIFYIT